MLTNFLCFLFSVISLAHAMEEPGHPHLKSTNQLPPDVELQCQILFVEATLPVATSAHRDSDVDNWDRWGEDLDVEPDTRGGRGLIKWRSGGVIHILRNIIGHGPANYSARLVGWQEPDDVTSRAEFEKFIKELNRVLALDPAVARAVQRLQVPRVADNELKLPPQARYFFPIDPEKTENYRTYRVRREWSNYSDLAPSDQSLHVENFGRLVWVSEGVTHRLHLLKRLPYNHRGLYEAHVKTPTGISFVTSQASFDLFLNELKARYRSNLDLQRILKLAGLDGEL